MSLSNSSAIMNYTTFVYNTATRAGAIHLERNASFVTYRGSFTNNGAYYQGGVFFAVTDSWLYLDDCDLLRNWANESSAIYALGTSRAKNITASETRISTNVATMNTITLLHTNTYFRNT
jgi:hypothetical protein